MSELERLIQEHCPNGVEFKPLEKCCQVLDNKRKPITKSAREAGEYPYYGANGIQDYVADYIFDGTFVLVGEDGSVMTANGNPVVNWAEGKIWVNNHAHIIAETDGVLLRYLYHYLQIVDVRPLIHGNIPKLTGGDFRALKIPVPPIEVQSEIVRILDNFTELTAELTAELTVELTARKKQYEYYRDKLLHLDGEHITIQDLFDTRNGFTPSKDNPEFWENGELPWFKLDDINNKGRVLSDSYLHITPKALKKSGLFPENSIIISTSATIGEYALITVPFLCNQRFTCMTVKPMYREKVDIKYLMHYCPMLSKYCKEHLNQGNFASVDMKQFMKFEFVIPPLDEQKHIVEILDRFDALCNDISAGLPAEIEARQKQYEYYRDKLLTFKEMSE